MKYLRITLGKVLINKTVGEIRNKYMSKYNVANTTDNYKLIQLKNRVNELLFIQELKNKNHKCKHQGIIRYRSNKCSAKHENNKALGKKKQSSY